jgi:hypothetical protein
MDNAPVKRRRWFRFSLRVLLAVVTVAAVWMGITMKAIRDRREAIRVIDEMGGTYGVRIVGPKWLRYLVGDDKGFYDALRVSLGPDNQGYDPMRPVTDKDISLVIDHFGAFTRMSALDLWGPQITDEGLFSLTRLDGLSRLRLNSTSISDRGLETIQALKSLEHLDLGSTNVSDAGLKCLIGLANLKSLDLSRTRVTKEGVLELQKSLPNTKISGP